LFQDLEDEKPEHIALSYYKNYRNGAAKTLKSILISASVRLAAFNMPSIARMTDHDDMNFADLGERQRAIFCVIPDSDTSLNYLVGLLYSQAFQELYLVADKKPDGRLPVTTRIIMDEFANVALPEDFERILSTCRSREISINIIIQNIAQLRALFKDTYEGVIGNCDSFLYLGGNETSTHKLVSEMMGKETLDTTTRGVTKGHSGSSSKNYQNTGRELLTPDEVRTLDNEYALLFIRGEAPVLDKKYNLMKHPDYKLTSLGGAIPYVREPKKAPDILTDLTQTKAPEDIEFTE
jgi:type IV secretion system protein VirD4